MCIYCHTFIAFICINKNNRLFVFIFANISLIYCILYSYSPIFRKPKDICICESLKIAKYIFVFSFGKNVDPKYLY